MNNKKTKKLPLFIGIGLCAVAAIAFFVAFTKVRNEKPIMVAKENIPAFSHVTSSEVEATMVPEASITDNDLTEDEFNAMDKQFTTTGAFLADQRIDARKIPEDDKTSFGVVLPDERVVAVTSSVAGISGGLIKAGDVVDVQLGSDGATGNVTASELNKVLCVTVDPNDCQGVMPDGVNVPEDANAAEQDVMVVLATPEADAGTIAGQSVNLALNPFCQVSPEGYFESPRSDQGAQFTCGRNAASDRLATRAPVAETDTTTSEAE